MKILFSKFFSDFSVMILGVCETIWGLFGGHFGGVLVGFRGKNYSKDTQNYKNLIFYDISIAFNRLFNE